jgi:hypothetical protein
VKELPERRRREIEVPGIEDPGLKELRDPIHHVRPVSEHDPRDQIRPTKHGGENKCQETADRRRTGALPLVRPAPIGPPPSAPPAKPYKQDVSGGGDEK